MRVKEILKTDSLAGSRIVINNNFKTVKSEFAEIDEFFIFDDNDNRIALTAPYVDSNEIRTNKIQSKDEIKVYKGDLLCIDFDEDGDLLIRQNSKCQLNVREKLEELSNITAGGIANEVEALILQDEAWVNLLTNKILNKPEFRTGILNLIINSNEMDNHIIDLIKKYAPEPQPVEKCDNFSIYARESKLYIHCNNDPDRRNDKPLADYAQVAGDTLTITKADIQPLLDEYGTGEDFSMTYTNKALNEEVIVKDGEYDDYGLDNLGVESHIIATGLGTEEEKYVITKIR